MTSYIHRIDPFRYFELGSFLNKYSDWILFTILLMFFISVVKLALRKRFEESRAFRMLVGSLGALLAFSMYYSIYKGWLHLNLLGLGLFGAFLLIIVIFTIIYSFLRAYGTHKSTSIALGYLLCYISSWYIFPNHADLLADIFPPLNGLLLIIFFVSVYRVVRSFLYHSKSPLSIAKDLKKTHFNSSDNSEIDDEISEDHKEQKLIKKKTLKMTKIEISTVDGIKDYLGQMIKIIREKGNVIDQEEIAQLTNVLREINKKENILKKGMQLINHHINAYKTLHRKEIPELQQRLTRTNNKKKRQEIEEEIVYQKKMLQAINFMQSHESKIVDFTQSLNRLLALAMQKIQSYYPKDALTYLEHAHKCLQDMKHIYQQQKELEKYLLKISKKTIKDLKREKKD